jgi:hypothetical protein
MNWLHRWLKGSSAGGPKRRRGLFVEELEDRRTPTATATALEAKFQTANQHYEDYSTSSDAGILAWDESYVMSSYLAMYDATAQTSYLDTFVQQANRVLSNATDPDGDGYLGWQTYRYSVNLVTNGGFETPDPQDPSLPAGWYRYQSTPATASLDWTQTQAGNFGLTVRSDPLHGWQALETRTFNPLVRSNLNYEPNTNYLLSFAGKTNGSKAGGMIQVIDYTTMKTLAFVAFHNTAWDAQSITFRTPAASGHDIRIRLSTQYYNVAGGSASFDSIQVRQYAEYAAHAGMITAPMAEFAALVRSQPALQTKYGATADRYVKFMLANVVPRWEPDFRYIGTTGGTYVFPDDGSSDIPRQSLPTNQNLAMARAMLWLAEATKNSSLLDQAKRLGTTFKSQLKVAADGSFTWNYASHLLSGDPLVRSQAEDSEHANLDVGFAIDAFKAGILFTASDINRFATTLDKVMWNGSSASLVLSGRVDGTGGASDEINLADWSELVGLDISTEITKLATAVLGSRQWNLARPYDLLTLARIADGLARPSRFN